MRELPARGLVQVVGCRKSAVAWLFTVLVAHFWTADERLSGPRLLGVVAGFLGVVMMIGPEMLEGLGNQVWAQLAVLGATLSYAVAGVYGRRFKSMGMTPMATATG